MMLLLALSGWAQADDLKGEAGLGLSYQPRDPSASRYETKPMPYLDLSWNDFTLDSDEGLSWNAIKGTGWSAGPFINYVDGRTANGPLRGLRDVSSMAQVGGFVQYSPEEWWRVFAQVGRAVGGANGQGGMLGRVGGELDYPVGFGMFGSTGLQAHFADQRQSQTFFGVSREESQASGIGEYHAAGGLQSWNLSQGVEVPLGPHWSLLGNVSWIHLENSAAGSTLVKDKGRVNQGEAQTAVAYKF
ncbi:MAG: MipA/OmpV family protein [Pseudomonas sp.]|uniref:MipA/OmpV family protein n=1 Tax=Pseudomonas abieticivorans TaxID=2931382 RepID=UPI0020BF6584|nr:MipA/OmpV family protein [Pseudomonas sp. PIA16]MDE1163816.1 MipA/OmpV family protein [Pseudomonas sp.]